MTTIGLLKTFIISHRTFLCDENFHIYNTVVITMVSMLHISSPELISVITALTVVTLYLTPQFHRCCCRFGDSVYYEFRNQ